MIAWFFVVAGMLLISLGTAIAKFSIVEIIAGYDPEKVKDKEGLAKWVGFNLIIMGVITVIAFSLCFFLPQITFRDAIIVFVAANFIGSILIVIGSKRFQID